ncbi:family 1 glycosylhydrolase [Streptomyces sp. Inha503]|uniref:family 1 glycosylhydrolase n=1 Tax=Streptomyces sp. Inha503 TaxID=3383314 RepID=UPI0039A232E9
MTSPRTAATVFPGGFLWGAATAAHQIEGNNTHGEDIALLAGAGLDTYRFSVEWVRIESEPGVFSRAELDHYLRMAATCRDAGVTPVVTLNHFPVAAWFARDGAWGSPDAPAVFARCCGTVAAHFGDAVTWHCTLNEPNLGALMTMGDTVPTAAMEDIGAVARVSPNVKDDFARRVGGAPGTAPSAKVGWTLALIDFQAAEGGEEIVDHVREAGGSQFLLDNFEWHSGYAMTFGLIAVDRTTFERTPKPSLARLGGIARGNGAEV